MDDPSTTTKTSPPRHAALAGRLPVGTEPAVTLSKNGIRHVQRLSPSTTSGGGEQQRVRETLSAGLACSECFSGPNLYRMLRSGLEYELQVMQDLANGAPAAPLSIHTSSGVPEALGGFLDALEPHLPWKKNNNNTINSDGDDELDWCVSLQLEGASAVWAAVDLLLQTRMLETGEADRKKVAVGATSYHGPPSTSFGGKSPLWHKPYQLAYPTPTPGEDDLDEEGLFAEFRDFLDANGDEIGVILFEPQWGSSQAAYPWPKNLLKRYIGLAKSRNIKVLCDEIMCGLGRHGMGTLFLSEAWDLDPDAVTFGKAIAAGVYPLSGAILKRGRNLLSVNKCTVMQSHTYAGSSTRALMAATEVLNEIPNWLPSITKLGLEMEHIFRYITKISSGMVVCQGQGLMWGGLFTREGKSQDDAFRSKAIQTFKKSCEEVGILPYFVPVGGFMVSPVIDIDVGTIYEIGERLEKAVTRTMREVGWQKPVDAASLSEAETLAISQLAAQIGRGNINDKCLPLLHKTRSCTSCSSFVCQTLRTRFVGL